MACHLNSRALPGAALALCITTLVLALLLFMKLAVPHEGVAVPPAAAVPPPPGVEGSCKQFDSYAEGSSEFSKTMRDNPRSARLQLESISRRRLYASGADMRMKTSMRVLRAGSGCGDRKNSSSQKGYCGGAAAGSDVCCGGRCVDVCTDVSNCGGCGRVCQYGFACCDGRCHDLSSDPHNCGHCGYSCPDACYYGLCSYY